MPDQTAQLGADATRRLPSKLRLLGSVVLLAFGFGLFYVAVDKLYREMATELPWDYNLEQYLETSDPKNYPTFDNGYRIERLELTTKRYICAIGLVGYLFIACAYFNLRRQYSLRLLIGVVVFGCVVSTMPFFFQANGVPQGRPLHVSASLRLGVVLTHAQVVSIEEQLQPKLATNVFPAELRQQLGLGIEDGIQSVAFAERLTGYGTQVIEMQLYLKPNLKRTQADTLTAFYWWYVKTLAQRAAAVPLPKPVATDNFTGLWNNRWQAASEQTLSK